MDNVIKKTNLGIAVQEAIMELGLEREKNKIMACLQRAFEEKYDDFKKTMNTSATTSTPLPLKGRYVSDNEFPIGEGDRQQHFRTIIFDGRLQNHPLNINTAQEKRPFTLIESFSKNEDNKKRSHGKVNPKMDRKMGGGGRKQQKR